MSRLDWGLAAGLAVFFAVGAVGHVIPAARAMVTGLAPLALLVTAAVVAVPLVTERRPGVGLWVLGASVIGFGLEAVGVETGVVFGAYSYGTVLGPRVLGVPLVIGVNWALVVLGAVSLTRRYIRSPVGAAALAAAITAGFDWVLEPFAVSAGYWSWQSGAVPLRNYAAWFLIALGLSAWFTLRRLSVRSPVPSIAVLVQAVFFAVLRAAGA